MAQAETQPDFDSMLQTFLVDLDGDGVPDAQMQAPAGTGGVMPLRGDAMPMVSNRERGQIQRRAMAGREPTQQQQMMLDADMPRLDEAGSRLGGVAAELSGVPAMVRGGRRIASGISEANPLMAAAGVGEMAFGALPIAGTSRMAAPVMNAFMGSALRAMGTSGALALPIGISDVQEAQAQTLTKRQQRDLEIERQRKDQEVAAERQRSMDQIAIDQQRQAAEAETRRIEEQASRDKNKLPWRERNPEIAAALPAIGYAAAAGIPAAGALIRNVGSYLPGSAASSMNRATRQGEDLLLQTGRPSAADTREVLLRRDQLTNYLGNQPSAVQEFVGNRLLPAGAGGILAYEGRVFPDQMDMRDVNLTPEQRQQAIGNIFDGGGFAMNALMGGLTGLSAQEAVDRIVPAKKPDVEKAAAVRDRLLRYRRAR